VSSKVEPAGSRRERPEHAATSGSGHRRARTLAGTLGLTTLGAALPGAGFLWTGRRLLGLAILLPSLVLVGAGFWYVGRDLRAALDFAFDPTRLQVAAAVLGGALLVWVVIVAATYLVVRPRRRSTTESVLGTLFVGVLCAAVAAPVVMGARYAMVQADLVETIFENNTSATAPRDVTEADPWGGRERVNLLLRGGDGGVNRDGVRTDTMIVVSMDTETGRTVTFSLPRNMMNARFPQSSPLHELYPDGYRGYEDPAFYMLNAVYGQIPVRHPGVLGDSDNEGADALKQAVGGSLGITIDYYLLVNLQGFKQIVDAMGGVTVNINEPIPIGGNTDLGVPPDDYLEPGPEQRLDGFEALWYSRGRYGSDDYERMDRQRCMVDAIIDEAQPLNLIRRYQALAAAGKEIVRSDVPRSLLPAFVDLALKVKSAEVTSVVFRSSEEFYPGDPDFAFLRKSVRKALEPPAPEPPVQEPGATATPTPSESPTAPGEEKTDEPAPGEAVDAADSCAYDPED